MTTKSTLTVNLNVGWRFLVVLGVTLGMLVLAFSAVGAQAGDPPTTNSVEEQPAADPPESAPTPLPQPPASLDGDMVLTTNGEWVPADSVGATPPPATGAGEVAALAALAGNST